MHQVQKCQKWCNYAHVEKNRSKSRNLSNEHLFVLFRGCRYILSSSRYPTQIHQDELWKLEGPSDEEIQAAKAAMAKVPGTATSKEPLGAMASMAWDVGLSWFILT